MGTSPIYKEYRIHVDQMPKSGQWISTIVRLGQSLRINKDSLTAKAARVPGEYPSEAEALRRARQYIDDMERSE
jgi:hypothetical protein